MDNLTRQRHTLAHLLAKAVVDTYPHAKLTIGPPIDNGFYYDVDFSGGDAVGEADLPRLEKRMRKLLPQWKSWERREVPKDEALAYYKDNPYKTELINEISASGEAITFYTAGAGSDVAFFDLCQGGHSDCPAKEIAADSFKLDRVAGAYWRGDEEKPMLTRIYGLAFDTAKELNAYEKRRAKAKENDHRKLGKELELFSFSELVGPGLPLWSPRGTELRQRLDEFVQTLRKEKGYQCVTIPHIAKKTLYETSGHWNKYSEDLFKVRAKEGDADEDEYVLKPMNCPHHTQIFDAKPRSYRDLPQRYAETTMVYRAEQSGELAGLTRVLSITQDDAHVFCRENQWRAEVEAIWDIVDRFYGIFGFTLAVRLSFRDPKTPEKYLGQATVWDKTEALLTQIASDRNAEHTIGLGEAAFYAPKIDFMATDSLDRVHQVATIQLDRMLPERFDLNCVNEDGEKERVVMIHAAIAGSLERFIAVLLEHLEGNLPLWLAPEQIRVIAVADSHAKYAREVETKLAAVGLRATLDTSKNSMGKKIRAAKQVKLPYFMVVGDKEMADGTVTLEKRDGSSQNVRVDQAANHLLAEVAAKTL